MNSNKTYSTITVQGIPQPPPKFERIYRGFSTVNPDNENFKLYDINLVKQDLINHFHIRKGERLMNPEFGTIIWDMLFEPMVESTKALIINDVNEIINYDLRTKVLKSTVTQYEHGLQIECHLLYLPYNVTDQLIMRFDQSNQLFAS